MSMDFVSSHVRSPGSLEGFEVDLLVGWGPDSEEISTLKCGFVGISVQSQSGSQV